MNLPLRLIALLWPLPLLPAFLWLTAEGHLNFGGGEKDLLLGLPLALFALLYIVAYGICWARHVTPKRSFWLALTTALGLLGLAWVGLFVVTLLGPNPLGIKVD